MLSINEDFELQWFSPSMTDWQKLGVHHYHFSVVDGESPSMDVICEALQVIQCHAQRNETVYIHCKSGQGRSATVVASYLIKVILIDIINAFTTHKNYEPDNVLNGKLMEQCYLLNKMLCQLLQLVL